MASATAARASSRDTDDRRPAAAQAGAFPLGEFAEFDILTDEAAREGVDKLRAGVLIGSAFGGFETFATAVEALSTQARERTRRASAHIARAHTSREQTCSPSPSALTVASQALLVPSYALS